MLFFIILDPNSNYLSPHKFLQIPGQFSLIEARTIPYYILQSSCLPCSSTKNFMITLIFTLFFSGSAFLIFCFVCFPFFAVSSLFIFCLLLPHFKLVEKLNQFFYFISLISQTVPCYISQLHFQPVDICLGELFSSSATSVLVLLTRCKKMNSLSFRNSYMFVE